MKILMKTPNISDNEYELITQLTQIRYDNNLTQKDLAKLCNTKQEVISRMESGTHSPTLKNICKIVNALGFDLVLLSKKKKSKKRRQEEDDSDEN